MDSADVFLVIVMCGVIAAFVVGFAIGRAYCHRIVERDLAQRELERERKRLRDHIERRHAVRAGSQPPHVWHG